MTDRAAELRALVARLYDATGRGDWAAAAAMLTDDFVATEAPGLPFSGEWRGRDGLQRLYQTVIPLLNVQALDVIETCVGEDHAVTLVDLVLPGDIGRARVAEMFRFRGDQCCEIRPYYFDPAPVWAAARANGFSG
jgi:ketosteroid isomerase-like protein